MQSGRIIALITTVVMMMHGYVQTLEVTVVPMSTLFSADKDVLVTINYKNNGPDTVMIYKLNLPSKQLFHPILDITRDGQPVEYVGRLMKRRPLTAADMFPLKPGKVVSAVAEVSSVYNMTESGKYVVQVKTDVDRVLLTSGGDVETKNDPSTVVDESNVRSTPAVLFVVGRRNALIDESVKFKVEPRATTYSFIGCSSSRQSSIISGLNSAKSYSSSALAYLEKLSTTSTRYSTWFGTYSLSNLVILRTYFTNIKAVFDSKPMTFDCGCSDDGVYAYVYANQPYKIYLCPEFWPSWTTGTDSKGGTLIHETSHFTVVAGTNDYAYGHTDCMTLARSSPSKAIKNADSYQYFSENNPALT